MEMTIGEKLKKGLAYIGLSLGSGFIATLISGLYTEELTPAFGGSLITNYGFPLSWFKKSIEPLPGNPTERALSLGGLFGDIAFWSLAIGVPLSIVLYIWYKSRK